MSLDPSTGLPRRIPKLKVRNRIEDLEPPAHLRGLTLDTPTSTQDAISPTSLDDTITPIDSHVPGQTRKPSRPTLESRDSNRSDGSDETQDTARPDSAWTDFPMSPSDLGRDSISPSLAPSTKKKSRFWGSLILKEPSTNAWKDFAELQKQEQALKGSQTKRLAEKKLPDHVPKVNSKWNGLPDHAQPPKNRPWKSSLDISRVSHSRASGYSDLSQTASGASRPSSGHSGHSSDSSNKTAKRVTSSRTNTPSNASTRSRKPTAPSKTVAAGDRVGPAMSTYSLDSPSPIEEQPTSMPTTSLFFPAEQDPPVYRSRVNSEHNITQTVQGPVPAPDQLDTPPMARIFTSTSTASPRPELALNVEPNHSRRSSISDEEVTPTQEQVSKDDRPPIIEADGVAEFPQTSPTLSNSSGPASPPGPHNFHNRFKKQYKTVQEIPQWPLPTNPEDVILESEPSQLPNRAVPTTNLASSVSSIDSPTQPSFFSHQADSTSSRTSSDSSSSPSSPVPPPSTIVHPLGIDLGTKPQLTTAFAPQSPPSFPPSTTSNHLIAPAFQPGRVKTRPFDLDTIAESDTTSIRAPSLYLSPNRSVVSVSHDEPSQQARSSSPASSTKTGINATSNRVSRASSEMSEQWHLSPEERTGLGAKVKTMSRAPWDVGGVGSDGRWSVGVGVGGGMGDEKRRGLIGRFRR